MTKISFLFLLTFILLPAHKGLIAQQTFDFGFERDLDVVVLDSSGQAYAYPWVGGLSNCHFHTIDMNFDGLQDLFVFERMGNKMYTFLNNGTPNTFDYEYAPEYANYFQQYPPLSEWVILKDYNCDGKKDLFSYSQGGIRVYENTSDSVLKFSLVTYLLNSYYYNFPLNLYLTSVDYPGIEDVDGDGDLDIIVFHVLGGRMQYHKNLSVERTGTCDTLDFRLMDECWGGITESDISDTLTLNDPSAYCLYPLLFKGVPGNYGKGDEKHVGSTMLIYNANNDTLIDMLLGDVDFPTLKELLNDGTRDSAHIYTVDNTFPSNTTYVDLVSFPVPSYVDIDNDGTNELIVSSFDPNYSLADNFNSVWLYENSGINQAPTFNFVQKDFLQSDMIDLGGGAYPVFFDYNNDGLEDLFVGNYGYRDSSYLDGWLSLHSKFRGGLALFKNIGTSTSPSFQLMDRDYANISRLYPDTLPITAVYPTFGDLDGDGDKDMIIGNRDGQLHYYTNDAVSGNDADFNLGQMYYMGIDVGEYATPQLIDLNRDGLLDLVIGERTGTLKYYKNTGSTSSPSFTLIKDTLGNIDVSNWNYSYYGYPTPCFFEDTVGTYSLFIGTEYGYIYHYKDIDSNLQGSFTCVDSVGYVYDSVYKPIREGARIAVAVSDLNNDTLLDMIVGNHAGGLVYYKGVEAPDISTGTEEFAIIENGLKVFPNPATDNLWIQIENASGMRDVEIMIFNLMGERILYQKTGPKNSYSINISALSPAMYIIQFEAKKKNTYDRQVFRSKFIVR